MSNAGRNLNQAIRPRPLTCQNEDALNRDAGQRLRKLLGREATAKEIRELRGGEQALGVEHPSYAKARQLVAEARNLRQIKDRLLSEVRKTRQRSERLHGALVKNLKT